MIEVLRALLIVSLAIPALIFGLYGGLLLYYGRLKKNKKERREERYANVEFEPLVSLVIPTHNEEMIIAKKIENLLSSDYPSEKLEIIFIDDSDDSTSEIIREYSKRYANIRLIKSATRIGYSPSMIAGCKAAKGKIVVLNDAGSFLDTKAIPNLVTRFQTTNIGVVTGKDVIMNVEEGVGQSENLYQSIYNFLRTAETNMDSTFYIKGEATGVRRDLIADLDNCGETFDTAVGLFVRQKGYKVVYDPDVKFYEYAPSTHSERTKQKTIRAANLARVLWHFRHLVFKREHGKYGCLILPMNFGMLVIAPLAILAGFTLLIALTFLDPSFSVIIWSILGSVFLFFLVYSRHFITTFLEFEYSLLKAIYQVVFTKKKHDQIDKVISTRRT